MNSRQLIDYIRSYQPFMENVRYWMKLDPVEGTYAEYPEWLDQRLVDYFNGKGISKLYSHQRLACDCAHAREDYVVVTPTASGKTMCYNLPVLNAILHKPEARALYLFPTKALAQDQLSELKTVIDTIGADIRTHTFDGDTPGSARRAIRSAGQIVITNPDMLHSGILPHHTVWVKLFEQLEYVVIDEIHSYRGVFGSHLANVLRRLRRLCQFYGSNPLFIMCSATIKNPGEHAERLTEKRIRLIDNNGAPRGERNYIVYNPPVVNSQLGIRASAVKESAKIGAFVLQNKVPAIIFARSRVRVEVISTYLRQQCPGVPLAAYRGGYLPNERRSIERSLREGTLHGVVSTNALELGIDIGMLDVVITTGYPGSISSLMQQFGRAGRRGDPSLAIMVATSSPLDQYIAGNPDFVVSGSPEGATINPDNLLILMDHIKCAAFELPFSPDERFATHLATTTEMLTYLEEMGVLKRAEGRFHWMSDIYPAGEISLRTASQENFVIMEKDTEAHTIGEVDFHSAPTLIHQDAIYMHQGRMYYIDELDWERRLAYCHEIESEYYTDAEVKTDMHVLEVDEQRVFDGFSLNKGEINVREKATMFKKIRFNTHENLGWGRIDLPEIEMHTAATWIDFDDEQLSARVGRERAGDVLYGLSYVLRHIAPVFAFCDTGDIHSQHQSRSSHSGAPAIYIYDAIPGGVGIAHRIYDLLPDIATGAMHALAVCGCEGGCPGCIGPMPGNDMQVKQAVADMLIEIAGGTGSVH